MKPSIGVTPDFNAGDRKEWGGREPTYFLRARYIRAIEELDGIPLVLPLLADRATRRRLLQQLDGLLLTGSGPDLPPSLYGERQQYTFGIMSKRRANFELDIVNLARQADVPLLGICGGMQTMNVACGGASVSGYLIPNLEAAPASATNSSDRISVTPSQKSHPAAYSAASYGRCRCE